MQLSTIPRRPLSTGEVSPLALLATLLAATFLIICAWYCKASLERISQHHEIGYWSFSKPIAGTHSLAHEFTAHSSTLGKFYAFAKREDLQQSRDETIVVELLDAVDLTVLLLTGLNLVVIHGFVRPLTDAGGAFFTVLFVAAFTDYAKEGSWAGKSLWVAASAAFLGILTRIALSPLLLVPAAFVLWCWLFSRPQGGFVQLVRPLTVSLVAAALVGTTSSGLQLWGSVAAARAFAAREAFTSAFSFAAFAENTVLATQLMLPLGLLHPKKVISDE